MATNARLGDMMIARGFRVATLGHDRFPVILNFLNEQEIYSMEDFEGKVVCRGCVHVLPVSYLARQAYHRSMKCLADTFWILRRS